ncbi:MAG: LTA synthase family protein [Fusobacteria bacterium]|nr:LTA synthase family protein [Fusobacteriota bacterium]
MHFKNFSNERQIVFLAIYFPLNILMIEMLAHLNILNGFLLLLKNPFSFLLNTILFSCITLFFLAILQKDKLVFSLMPILSAIIGLGTKLKIDFRGVGLNILDFMILKEAGEMTNNLTTDFIVKSMLMLAFFMLIFVFIIINLPEISLNPKIRKNGILIFITIIVFLYFIGPYTITVNSGGIKRKLYIEESGSLYYFAAQIKNNNTLSVPDKEEVTTNLLPILTGYQENIETIKPDIVIIQNESFTDPTLLGQKNFSEDPLEFFHSLQQEANSFNISVPSFCGGTANTEYEIITGLSTMFYPSDATVFANYMTKPSISIGSILRTNSYDSTLLHPFHSTFYSRNIAYKLLGFNSFYGLEYLSDQNAVESDVRYWDSIKEYMSDDMIYSLVQKELANPQGSNNKFIFAVTMQNHTPFTTPTGYEDSVQYLGNNIKSQDTLEKYNDYLSNLKASDDALKSFITYLKDRKEPTIVLFYGDHYPKINQNGNAYAEIGLVDDLASPENDYILHEVPAFIWSNYKDVGKSTQTLDSSLVSAKLLSLAGLDMPNYMKINHQLANANINSMTSAYLVMNNTFYYPESEEYKKVYKIFSDLNGDISSDNKFLENKLWYIEDNKDFTNPQSQTTK